MMTVSLVFGIVYNCLLFLAHTRQGGMLAGGVACLALNALSVFLLLFGVRRCHRAAECAALMAYLACLAAVAFLGLSTWSVHVDGAFARLALGAVVPGAWLAGFLSRKGGTTLWRGEIRLGWRVAVSLTVACLVELVPLAVVWRRVAVCGL